MKLQGNQNGFITPGQFLSSCLVEKEWQAAYASETEALLGTRASMQSRQVLRNSTDVRPTLS